MRYGLLMILQLAFEVYAMAKSQLNSVLLSVKIDEYLNACVANGYAASVLVAKNDKIILSKGYGMANLELNTDNGNLSDTLGEAFYLFNKKDSAVISFKKALELKPDEHCHWCLNASNRLKELSGSK